MKYAQIDKVRRYDLCLKMNISTMLLPSSRGRFFIFLCGKLRTIFISFSKKIANGTYHKYIDARILKVQDIAKYT